ncbi:BLOC-1-related complex subunit 5 [Macrobrachium rosenbergii]|uniref:BLOC-1-related complex subunit 5 n=1 Tax=Macrobrachium rosenbergii TaxID=79674 RepID=UPI0034D5FA5B
MGGEQSRDAGGVVGVGGRMDSMEGRGPDARPTSTSPRPSICSDADLPYISYTVNRPIGDSPKHTSRGVRGLRGGGGSPRKSRRRIQQRPQEVVVVREAASNSTGVDPELARLQSIPTFLPIMRGALTAPSARDPEVLERLDAGAMTALCKRYQAHLHAMAYVTSHHQDNLSAKIREVDATMSSLVSQLTERQKSFARHAEKLSQVTEVSHALARCHASLNLILESLETLNDSLPIQERLEPFVWTTG